MFTRDCHLTEWVLVGFRSGESRRGMGEQGKRILRGRGYIHTIGRSLQILQRSSTACQRL
ncbi:hypothetical protein B0H10DRAFT_2058813 [Mycena sp. CBHHK59/15]|nr:hypothetical protein B0H10DRAFT_2058745 [Mycena sp. CBHHK59/15]KAJ6610844.1 hypothetical protein B0H10DRAFT_2058813 [Mycena sp. CBHHK59/15]